MLYFSIELFVDALILLLHSNTARVQRAINQLIEVYERETKEASYKENEFFDFFIHLLREIMTLGITIDNRVELDTFILKFKSNVLINKDPELLTTLKNIFSDTQPMSKDRVEYTLRKITNCLLWYNNTRHIKKMFGKLSNSNNTSTVEKQEEMLNELSALCTEVIQMNKERTSQDDDETRTKFLNFDDKESIAKSLKVYQRNTVTNVFRTGLQGLNRSLGPRGGFAAGEALPNDTPIKIPGGWKAMGELQVGDTVTAADGTPTRVCGVFPQGKRSVYAVTLADGRTIKADANHRWLIRYWRSHRNKETTFDSLVLTTRELLDRLSIPKWSRNTYIPLCASEQIEDVDLPIHPYVLGSMMGDGSIKSDSLYLITDHWVVKKVASLCPQGVIPVLGTANKSADGTVGEYRLVKSENRHNSKISNPLRSKLRELGYHDLCRAHEKYIPESYLLSSHAQRIALLQGLFDTDGHISKRDNASRGSIEYSTTSKRLANDVAYLIRSIGGKAHISEVLTSGYRAKDGQFVLCKPLYRISVSIQDQTLLFTLPKKLERCTAHTTKAQMYTHTRVTEVVPIASREECTCIQVEHPDHLFVAHDFIVTHNSVVFNAMSFSGKSLILLKMARWAVTLNKVSEDVKNPTCVLYSLENETSQNLMQLFNEMWINEYKEKPPTDITEEQIINYCFDSFRRQGWHLIIERRLGAEFGFAEFVATFEEYKRNGFTVLVCIVDYLNMMRGVRNGDRDAAMGNHLIVRELYTNMCNYLKTNNCTFVTAHQLNRKAAEIVRQNPMGAVKRFTIDCLADGMDPQREVDCAFYQNIEHNQLGNKYLTFKIDKHRYDTETRDADKYFAYKFSELGILDDVDGPDMSTTNIYAEKVKTADGDEGKTETNDLNLFGE